MRIEAGVLIPGGSPKGGGKRTLKENLWRDRGLARRTHEQGCGSPPAKKEETNRSRGRVVSTTCSREWLRGGRRLSGLLLKFYRRRRHRAFCYPGPATPLRLRTPSVVRGRPPARLAPSSFWAAARARARRREPPYRAGTPPLPIGAPRFGRHGRPGLSGPGPGPGTSGAGYHDGWTGYRLKRDGAVSRQYLAEAAA